MQKKNKDYTNFEKSRISNLRSEPFLKTNLPLAGQFLKKEEIGKDKTFPLTLSFCEQTASIQVNESINPEILFSKYLYKTGAINTLTSHLESSASVIKKRFKHKKIADLGCNDFTFLKNFLNFSQKIVGIDPSDVSKNNQVNGIDLENVFFSYKASEKIKAKHGEFDIVFSSNNFAHIENIQDYTLGISNLLSKNGNFICEVHWAGTLIKSNQFPFIYHEHLYYYTLKSLKFLLEKFNLFINSIEQIDIHGGSIRVFASKKKYDDGSVEQFLIKEQILGLHDIKTYKDFNKNIELLKKNTKQKFLELKEKNKLVYGYGASGQANTLMSFFEIEKENLKFIIDDSPLKSGLFTPRNHIEIKDRSFLNENPPDCIYVLAYTFLNEIVKKNNSIQSEWIPAI